MEYMDFIIVGLYIQSRYYEYITLYNRVKLHH